MNTENTITYRRATFNDCDLLFAWANDLEVRKNSHNGEPIQYEGHVMWLKNKLSLHNGSWLYIILQNNCPAGLLRLDRYNDDLYINYSVAKEFRKMGLGSAIIHMVPQIINNESIPCGKLIAEVLYANEASNRIFTSLGYKRQTEENKIIYVKNIE